jgi:FecR protein/Putative zinc-finger
MNTRKELLHQAIDAMQSDGPDSEAVTASAARISERLGLDPRVISAVDQIRSCEDVRNLLPDYREGHLPEARALLVKAHLSDCGACLRSFREGSKAGKVDWSAPASTRTPRAARISRPAARPSPAMGWALAFSFALAVASFFVYRTWWMVPPGVRAEVAAIDGSAYLISESGDRKLAPGEALNEGDRLRTTGASRATIRLSDGSTVDVNERTAIEVGARGRDMTVSLDGGDVIVQAAKRTRGHLYVRTPDCRVAVTGTVFTVNAGLKGSRVSVLQGNVQVNHSGIRSMLQPGDQITTSDNLAPEPLESQVSWSPEREKYIGILAQLALLEHKISQIPLPGPRYSSDLLPRVPADTLLYVSIPNLGDFLTQANQIFHDQLSQSQELQQWWQKGHNNSEKLDSAVEKIHEISTYLGNEAVIVAVKEPTHPGFAVMADVQKSGLADLLKQQAAAEGATDKFIVIDEPALASLTPTPDMHGAYALVRPGEVVFSNDVALLKTLNAQLNAGPSGFAVGDFGKQIASAYDRGAGIILAADLHQMMASMPAHMPIRSGRPAAAMANSGIENLRYLIAEHREVNGAPQNHLNIQFSGTRQRVASWLGAPAPLGSLDFVSTNASIAVAGLTKDPKTIADDLIAMAARGAGTSPFDEANSKLGINLREDLIANLGGDFLVALDGPVLPTPSWKAVIEVNNSNQLQYTLEHLVQAINSQQDNPGVHKVAIDPSDAGGQRFYAVRDVTSGAVVANYTYSGGYMIIAPTRALLMDALKTHDSGTSLGRSASFRALLPRDQNENYSAVAYQNLSPVLSPLLQRFSGESADALRKLAADARPTVICAYGQESRIEVASDSRMFGFDFLTLGALIGNKPGHNIVRQ